MGALEISFVLQQDGMETGGILSSALHDREAVCPSLLFGPRWYHLDFISTFGSINDSLGCQPSTFCNQAFSFHFVFDFSTGFLQASCIRIPPHSRLCCATSWALHKRDRMGFTFCLRFELLIMGGHPWWLSVWGFSICMALHGCMGKFLFVMGLRS